jgi:hypothetical protein
MVKKNKIFVNGPIMAVRLEGKVNNINKVIYLFGDLHLDINSQTNCSTYDSVEFPYYFIKMMKKTDKNITFDFFMEAFYQDEYDLNNEENHKYRNIYIYQVRKFFGSKITITNNINNDNKENKKLKDENLRLHYIDIRNKFYSLNNNLVSTRNTLINYFGINDNSIEELKYSLNEMNRSIDLSVGILLNNVKEEDYQLYENDEVYKYIKHYSLKLLNKYKNSNIRNKLLDETFILNQMKKYIQDIKELSITLENNLVLFNETIKKFKNKKYKSNYNLDLETRLEFVKTNLKIIDIILDKYDDIYVLIMDIYFLRKFLDKDYITNVIAYTGMLHIYHYVWILVKNFDFKITHSTNQDISIDEMNTNIKNNEYDNNFTKITPNELLQCIDMSFFPKYFK